MRIVLSAIITLLLVASCSKSGVQEEGVEYTISGTISQDSVQPGPDVTLFVDKHNRLIERTIPVTDGKFEYQGRTTGIDEIFILDSLGHSVSLFAEPGTMIDIVIKDSGIVEFAGTDTINNVLRSITLEFDKLTLDNKKRKFIDSISDKFADSFVSSLLIRDRMCDMKDSVVLRQCLGRLNDNVKPQWLMKDIEKQFDNQGLRLKKNVRLYPLPKYGTEIDTVFVDFSDSRQNAFFLYFWADYSQQSVDSLQMLTPIAKQYGLHEYIDEFTKREKDRRPKRVDIVTICLHAADSAAWKKHIEGLPGSHILLQDGFANKAMRAWKINRVPYNAIIDRFSNIQESYQWGKDLRDALERMPNNYTIQTSPQVNGSKNRISRSTRH